MRTAFSTFIGFLVALMFCTTANAATTGTLTFKGQINGGTCNLDAGDVSRTITLDTVKVSDFESASSAGQKTFNLTANCDSDVSNVVFTFTGTPALPGNYRFLNTGNATGIGLWLYSWTNGTPNTITATTFSNTRTVATIAGKAVLPLGASYYKVAAPIEKGSLTSTVTVNIAYN